MSDTIVKAGLSLAQNNNLQLADIIQHENLIGWELANKQRTVKPLVTFISDDGTIEDYTILKSIFATKNVPCVLAIITNVYRDINPAYMTLPMLLELQNNYGYEIASHTKSHSHLTELTDAQVEEECSGSLAQLNADALNCNILCIPYGDYNSNVENIAKKYYRAIRTSITGINKSPFDTFKLMSIVFGDEVVDLNVFKAQVDTAFTNNEWLIFLFHGNNVGSDPLKTQALSDLIDYIKAKDIGIVTMSQGLDEIGNIVETQDFKIAADGKASGSQINTIQTEDDAYSATDPITKYKDNTLSITRIGNDKSFPTGTPGLLLTYRYSANWTYGYSHQEFHLVDGDDVYRRKCLTATTWDVWRLISLV